MLDSLIQSLNPAQQEAVRLKKGPVLILAGAGSGKTRVITVRIAALIRGGILPNHILAVTFTNKAAAEMNERLGGIVGSDIAEHVTTSTFHKLGVMLLRQYGRRLGLSSNFSIIDSEDQLNVVRDCMREEKISLERYEPQWMRNRISGLKNKGVLPGEGNLPITDVVGHLVHRAYKRYSDTLTQMSAVDFDDLLLKPLELLRKHPDVVAELQDRFRYIHVDEFQDTNGVQMELILFLSREHRNLCVVGDDDQSIYGWRGAQIENVLNFEKYFPEAKLLKLTQNYRSTAPILEAANAVIANNRERRVKELWTATDSGAPVRYRSFDGPDEEAEFVSHEIERLQVVGNRQPRDFGILYRANSQARAIEQALRIASIPYRVVGGLTFFDRKEVKDALAYLRVCVNPADELALRRAVSFPSRGVGIGALARLNDFARKEGIPIGLAAARAREVTGMHKRAMNALVEFSRIFRFRPALVEAGKDAMGGFSGVLDEVGFREGLRQGAKAPEDIVRRRENLDELLTGMAKFMKRRGGQVTAVEYLRELSLAQTEEKENDKDNRVVLMTLHSSKGLEFPVAFLPGLEEGIIPHHRSVDSGDVDEERRLFYVGITRAKQELILSGCRRRRSYNKTSRCVASRFLDELPDSVVRQRKVETADSEAEAHEAAMEKLAALFSSD